ncbi:hypothetical protein Sru01_43850 [Sphaerisporangium rufum]|uniref:Lipoprotein n=1 Tax=Sphaerisporangium rufum TaxID=1381558 RepID=A0A919R5B8_9ACTN|nr:hypothetical protein [Sphaerisporangium rufum]GII79403.1 hypothetical protein Sru01_43850 [Sphaerisporangium rufum]
MKSCRLLLAVPLLALATACGGTATAGPGDAAGPVGTSAAAPDDARVKWARCLRENGVPDFPDNPDDVPSSGVAISDEAFKACEKYHPGKRIDTKDPAYLDRMTKLARCLRGKGIDFPDPGPNGELPPPDFDGGNKEKFAAALKACDFTGLNK